MSSVERWWNTPIGVRPTAVTKAVKTKGNNLGKTRAKLMDLKRINDSLIYVVQNPGFEELIKNKNNA